MCYLHNKCVTGKYLWCKYHEELWWSRAVRQGWIKGSLIGVVVGSVSLSIFGTKNVSPAPGGWSSLTQVQHFAHPEVERAMKTKPEQRLKTAQLSGAVSKQNLQISRTTHNANHSFSRWQKQSWHKINHTRPFFHILAQCSSYCINYLVSAYSWCFCYSKWSYP